MTDQWHAEQLGESYKLCRDCHGWGTVTIKHGGGLMTTEDCRRCAGTGEETQ